MISNPRKHLFQHFAIEVDGQRLTVSQVDFTAFPFGDVAGYPGYIQGSFTVRSAQNVAAQIPVRTLAPKLITGNLEARPPTGIEPWRADPR